MIFSQYFVPIVRHKSGFGALLILICTAPSLLAQASSATGERTLGVSVFAGGSFIKSAYQNNDKGFVIGGDLTHHFRLFDPSLELRYTRGTGAIVNESSFAAGLKAERRFGPVRPFVDFEFGSANITFNHPLVNPDGSLYAHDNSLIDVVGGGMDYPLTPAFSLKVDAQYQIWKLGTIAGYTTPVAASVGIIYRLPFKQLPGRH